MDTLTRVRPYLLIRITLQQRTEGRRGPGGPIPVPTFNFSLPETHTKLRLQGVRRGRPLAQRVPRLTPGTDLPPGPVVSGAGTPQERGALLSPEAGGEGDVSLEESPSPQRPKVLGLLTPEEGAGPRLPAEGVGGNGEGGCPHVLSVWRISRRSPPAYWMSSSRLRSQSCP